jgi:SAM-dependent methyltransferase
MTIDTVASAYWLDGFARQAAEEASASSLEEIHAWYQDLLRPWAPGRRRVLDIGCGPGRVIKAIAALSPDALCVGIDGRLETLSAAHRYLAAAGVEADLHLLDVAAPGFGRPLHERYGGFDLITSLFVLHHYAAPRIAAIIGELRTLLNPGGVLVLAEAHDPLDVEAREAELICAELAALAGQRPDLLLSADVLREACCAGGVSADAMRFIVGPARPFTRDEEMANREALDRLEAHMGGIAHAIAGRPEVVARYAGVKRVVARMIEHGIAKPARFAPLLAVLSNTHGRGAEGDAHDP